MRWIAGLAAGAALLLGPTASANDSSAESAAGGLVLRQNRDIDMLSEDLYVSAAEIRVRYVFRNRSRRPVRTIVAFPLPDRNLAEYGDGDRGWPRDFRTQVDGRPVRMQVEHRAFLGNVEHSALLRELRIPIAAEVALSEPGSQAIERLAPGQRERLERLGLIEGFNDGGRRRFQPMWIVRETWHWTQTFPAGRNVTVAHRYAPGAGGTVTTGLLSHEYRQGEGIREWRERYCIDDAFMAGVDRLQARARAGEIINVGEEWVSYILTTGGNWRSPIGEFRLVVDKGLPGNLVSFCGEGVRRISPTQFEIRRRNWRPTRDLNVLILRPDRPID
ncbi:DUF4424 domain-containing protein [Sphingosinicella sp.]|uniref:DUF4424 domain-containing protein n=1 Tax=Sphingosinicella sp. TaxID=1917971 RepID=UPI004037D535